MPDYIVRVELQGANQINYEQLNVAMRQAGFSTMINADSGKVYQLPTAEYVISGSPQTGPQLCAQVKALADGVRGDARVLVTQALSWSGSLVPVHPPPGGVAGT